jgi:hypothetical protein
MTPSGKTLASLLVILTALTATQAQSHPVGAEWRCSACSSGQVCYRENAEFTICRAPQGSHIVPRGPDISAQIAQATARIQQNPRDANAWVSRAVYYLTPTPGGGKPPLQNAEAAVRDLETALKLDPNNFYALHNYGHVAYLLDYDDFAIYEFTKAIAVNPRGSARSYMGRGWAYYQECKFDPAVANFKDAVRLDSSLQSQIAGPQKFRPEGRNARKSPPSSSTGPPIRHSGRPCPISAPCTKGTKRLAAPIVWMRPATTTMHASSANRTAFPEGVRCRGRGRFSVPSVIPRQPGASAPVAISLVNLVCPQPARADYYEPRRTQRNTKESRNTLSLTTENGFTLVDLRALRAFRRYPPNTLVT